MNKCENCKNENKEIDIVKKYSGKPTELINCLQHVQGEFGYIPQRICVLISNELGVPESDIYSVITFYKQFKLKPKAKYTIEICMGTACYVLGAEKLSEQVKKILNLTENNYTEDGKFELVNSRCLGCCGIAPVMSVNGKIYGSVKPQQVEEILKNIRD